MQDQPSDNSEDFPRTGFRARRWARFERDLHAWLATPEGRFVSWAARRQVDGSENAGPLAGPARLRSAE
jgi:hypothetical protein